MILSDQITDFLSEPRMTGWTITPHFDRPWWALGRRESAVTISISLTFTIRADDPRAPHDFGKIAADALAKAER